MQTKTSNGLRRVARGTRRRAGEALVNRLHAREALDPADGSVALTFDDGPHPEHTLAVLDELARLGVVATFFLVGQRAAERPDLVRKIVDAGHAVGSHSSSHLEPWTIPLVELAQEYRRGRSEVEDAAGRPVALFRPPKGYVDARGAAAMRAAGVRPWLWTIDPQDWRPGVSAAEIVAGTADLAAGDVVLLHDAIEGPLDSTALDRSATCAALDGIASLARDRGLRFVTLP